MDEKERQLFTLIWSLAAKHQQLLGDVLPTVHEIVAVLSEGRTPSSAQLHTWRERYDAFDERLHELNAAYESIRQIADPLFGYDA